MQRHSRQSKTIFSLIISLILFSCPLLAKLNIEQVSLQLDWKFQYEFAGFIMAKEKGFYQEAGLDVKLIEYQQGDDTVEKVLSQQHNYGIYNSSFIVDKQTLKPTVLMATYFQQSPLVFVTSKNIKHPKDLAGKNIMLSHSDHKNNSLALLMNHFLINQKNITITPHTFNADDFISHKVDAMSAFRTNEIFELENQGVDYNIIDPADYGFATTAVNVFTSFSEATNHPERTRRFVSASNKGWAYALKNPEETINTIHQLYAKNKSIEALRYEEKISKQMMLLDFFNIGEVNMDLSLRLFKQLQFNHLIGPHEKISSFLLEDILNKLSSTSHFTQQQHEFLQRKKEITMCVDPLWMPFERIKNGQHIGISNDVFDQFRQQLPIPIRLIPTTSWQQSITYTKARRCDILSLVSKTPERSLYMDFTEPYLTLPIVVATKTDTFFIDNIKDVQHKKLGAVKGYAIAEKLRRELPDINIVDVNSINDGLTRVQSGELFGYIDTLMVVAHAIQQDFTGILKVSARLKDNVKLSIGIRNDQAQLKAIFNTLIKSIDEAELQASYNKWVPIKQDKHFDYLLAGKFFIAVVILALAYLFHYLKLTKLNRLLLIQSTTDKLTSLYNRAKTDSILLQIKSDVVRYDTDLSIILLDIDHFKRINDTHGHLIGDQALVEFSQLIKHNVRVNDSVGRWGGEEFLIICPNTSMLDANELANKLLRTIRSHAFKDVGVITASAGISQLSSHSSIQTSLQHVDSALYKAKNRGRDQAIAFSDKDI